MIIALAGRRVDAAGAAVSRFPIQQLDTVKRKLIELFKQLQPRALISSAACGADLLALEVAGELGIRRCIVLPFDQQQFKSSSVTDRPGDWGNMYDEICKQVVCEDGLIVLNYPQNDDETYRRSNIDIIEKAKALADKHDSKNLVAVIVWDGRPRDDGDITDHFRKQAKDRGFKIQEVHTLIN